jgi:hypothetical protein
MAQIELCADVSVGPYLIAPDSMGDELKARFDGAGPACSLERGVMLNAAKQPVCLVCFGVGAVLGPISHVLNDGGYDWELAGLPE